MKKIKELKQILESFVLAQDIDYLTALIEQIVDLEVQEAVKEESDEAEKVALKGYGEAYEMIKDLKRKLKKCSK